MKILLLISLILLKFWFSASDTASPTLETFTLLNATNLTKPGCESRCGDLVVPYPFGIGLNSNCSINPNFAVHCNNSLQPPKAFFSKTDYSSIKLISDSTVRISNAVSTWCYFPDGATRNNSNVTIDFTMWPAYSISQTNKFTLIGCKDSAWITSQRGSRKVFTGCLVSCSREKDAVSGECFGSGCCQSSIPQIVNNYQTHVYTVQDLGRDEDVNIRSFNPCTHAFVGEENAYKFDATTDLNDASLANRIEASVPLVLDWAIGNLSCSEAEGREDFACQENSRCLNSTRLTGGYRCICKEGYQGNPYLYPGCHDFNECLDRSNFPCFGTCMNTVGGYLCKCKRGLYGDAKIKGGCHRSFRPLQFSLGVFMGIGVLIFSFWLIKVVRRRNARKCKEKIFKKNGGLLLQQQMLSGGEIVENQIRIFTTIELQKATGKFSEDRIVGQGGQGVVYKGMLCDGRIVAIKKSTLVDKSQVKSFINEVFILSQINHKNVVKLLGCCLETEVPMLVYEFITNGTVFDFIHDENYEFPTLWKIRLQIATEVARVVAYLHSTSIPILHRDIQSSNILLDDKFRAKLTDFGISKSIFGYQTNVNTSVKGTTGYLDPEYYQSNHLTEKSDVYSFGIVLLELLTGKKPIFSTPSGESIGLATFILSMTDEQVVENVDDRVSNTPKEQLIAFANLAKRCINLNGMLRPNMQDVARELEALRMSD